MVESIFMTRRIVIQLLEHKHIVLSQPIARIIFIIYIEFRITDMPIYIVNIILGQL